MQQPPLAQSNYNYPLPRVPLTASQVGTKIPISIGGSFQQSVWVEMSNESPYTIACYSLQGVLLNSIQPQICDIFQLPQGDNSFIVIPGILIPLISPSSELDINIYPFGQPSGPYPFPLARQSASIGPSGQTGWTWSLSFSAPTVGPSANIFNPLNSGVNALIYAASGENGGTAVFTFTIAANKSGTNTGETNSNNPAAFSHLIGNPASSKMIVSWSQTANFFNVGDFRSKYCGPGLAAEFLTAPNQSVYVLPPGGNFQIRSNGGTAPVSLTMEWNEQ